MSYQDFSRFRQPIVPLPFYKMADVEAHLVCQMDIKMTSITLFIPLSEPEGATISPRRSAGVR